MKSYWWQQIQRVLLVLLLGVVASGLTACGDDDTPPETAKLTALTLSASSESIKVGEEADISVTGATATIGNQQVELSGLSEEALDTEVEDGNITETQRADIVAAVEALEWTASPANGVDISGSGDAVVATGAEVGDVTITVTVAPEEGEADSEDYEPISADVTIEVVAAADDLMAALESGGLDLLLNSESALTVQSIDADGNVVEDVTGDATFEVVSGDEFITVDSDGNVTGIGVGTGTVSITVGDLTTEVEVSVYPSEGDIEVVLSGDALVPGGTSQLSATVTLPSGDTQDVTGDIEWSSDNEDVATVDQDGVVTGVGTGEATITGKIGDTTVTITVTVANAVSSVELSISEASLYVGETVSITATATMADGTEMDVTDMADWSSDTVDVASVDDAGEVTAEGAGQADVTATYMGVESDPAMITVEDVAIASIQVSGPASAAAGTDAQFTAVAVYNNGDQADITDDANWSTDDSAVATAADGGVVTGVAPGNVTVSASMGGVDGTADFEVTDATLDAIVISGPTNSTNVGVTVQLMAEGQYSDGSNQDITSVVTWSSETPAIVSVDGGLVTPLSQGLGTIKAAYQGVEDTFGLSVSDAVVVSLVSTPGTVSVAQGQTETLSIEASYSAGPNVNVTSSATYTSDDTTVATVAGGVVTGVAAGTATVLVQLDGVQLQVPVTVTAAVVTELALSPAAPSVPVGTTRQLTALATFSDEAAGTFGTDLTADPGLTWTSSASDVTVSQDGLVSVAPDATSTTATITATWSNGVSATSVVTVNPAVIDTITVQPVGNTSTVPVNFTLDYVAIATLTDGSTLDVTSTATWSSASAATATVVEQNGVAVVTGVAAGTVDITAAQGGKTGSATVTVSAVALTSLTVTPVKVDVPKGQTRQFTATGVFEDGSSIDVTELVEWSVVQPSCSTCPPIATNLWVTISNQPGTEGLASANQITVASVGEGGLEVRYATITAKYTTAADQVTSTPVQMAVTSDRIQSVAVYVLDDALSKTSNTPVLPVGEALNLVADCTYEDGIVVENCQDIISFTGTAPGVAAIDNTLDTLTGLVAGGTVITAVKPANATADFTANSVTVSVQDCVFDNLSVVLTSFVQDGPYRVLPLGASSRALAALVDTNGGCGTVNLSSGVSWTSSIPGSASVNSTGDVTASATPSVPVTAWPDIGSSPGLAITLTARYVSGTNSFTRTGEVVLREACINALTAAPAISARMPIPQTGSSPSFVQDTTVTGSFSVEGLDPVVLTDASNVNHQILDSAGDPIVGTEDPFTALDVAASGFITTNGDENEGTVAVRVSGVPNQTVTVGSNVYRYCAAVEPAEFSVTTVDTPVTAVTVTAPGNRTTIGVGETGIQLSAVASFADDSITPWPVAGNASWDSNNNHVAVNGTGVVSGSSAGESIISALYEGQTGTLAMSASGRTLESVYVGIASSFDQCADYTTSASQGTFGTPVSYLTGSATAFSAGLEVPLVVVGLFSDGAAAILPDVTPTLSGTGATLAGSTLTTTGAGTVTLSATAPSALGPVSSGTSGSLELDVVVRDVTQIEITDAEGSVVTADPTLPAGANIQLGAQISYAGGTSCEGTEVVTWGLNTGAKATVTQSGLVTIANDAVASDSIDVSATLGADQDVVSINVVDACLASLKIAPATVTLLEGSTTGAIMTVTGTMSNAATFQSTGSTMTWALETVEDVLFAGATPTTCPTIAGLDLEGWICANSAGTQVEVRGGHVANDVKMMVFYNETLPNQPVSACDGTVVASVAAEAALIDVQQTVTAVVLDCEGSSTSFDDGAPNFTGLSLQNLDNDNTALDLPVGVRGYCTATAQFSSGEPADVTDQVTITPGATGSVVNVLAKQTLGTKTYIPFTVSSATTALQSLQATYSGVQSNVVNFQAVQGATFAVAVLDADGAPVTGEVTLPMFQNSGLPVTLYARATVGLNGNAATYNVTDIVNWSSSAPTEMTLTKNGNVRLLAAATDTDCTEALAEVTADHSLTTPDTKVQVRPQCAACVQNSIEITRPPSTVALTSLNASIGEAIGLKATCVLDVGPTVDVTSVVTWSDNSPSFAVVAGNMTVTGPTTTGAQLTAQIGASTEIIAVNVVAPCVEELRIVDLSGNATAGRTVPGEVPVEFQLQGRLSDQDTEFAALSTMTVSNADSHVTTGSAAEVVVGDFAPVANQCPDLDTTVKLAYTVVDQVATDLVVTSTDQGALPLGSERQYKANASYAAGTFDVAAYATWTIANTSVLAEVGDDDGLVRGDALGTTSLEASFITDLGGASQATLADSTPVTVTSAVLTGIELQVFDPEIAGGASAPSTTSCEFVGSTALGAFGWTTGTPQLPINGYKTRVRVVGAYSDGSNAVLSSGYSLAVTRVGGAAAGATVSQAGMLTSGAATESLVVTASATGLTDATINVNTVAGSLTQVVTLNAQGNNGDQEMAPGQTANLFAEGSFLAGGNATWYCVSDNAAWANGGGTVATVSASGIVSALAAGTDSLSATVGGIEVFQNVVVSGSVIKSIAISPVSVNALYTGETIQFQAFATLADNTVIEVTDDLSRVKWIVDGDGVLSTNELTAAGVTNPANYDDVCGTNGVDCQTNPTGGTHGATAQANGSVVLPDLALSAVGDKFYVAVLVTAPVDTIADDAGTPILNESVVKAVAEVTIVQ